MKKCNKCKLEKDFAEYTLCKANKDGYYNTCKECRYGHRAYKAQKEGLKTCTICKQDKDISMFHISNRRLGTYHSWCKVCRNNYRHVKRMENPEKEYLRKRIEKLKEHYGITVADYDRMYIEQVGKCLICKNKYAKLDIDHCHSSGKVRGLLCGVCNRALGLFKDNSIYLTSAIEYLKLSKTDKS